MTGVPVMSSVSNVGPGIRTTYPVGSATIAATASAAVTSAIVCVRTRRVRSGGCGGTAPDRSSSGSSSSGVSWRTPSIIPDVAGSGAQVSPRRLSTAADLPHDGGRAEERDGGADRAERGRVTTVDATPHERGPPLDAREQLAQALLVRPARLPAEREKTLRSDRPRVDDEREVGGRRGQQPRAVQALRDAEGRRRGQVDATHPRRCDDSVGREGVRGPDDDGAVDVVVEHGA